MALKDALKKLNVERESELGEALFKLDQVYERIAKTKKEIKKFQLQLQQLNEDAELMESLLMHKFNKDTRAEELKRWDS